MTGTEVPFIPGATEPFERFEIEERNLWLALQYRHANLHTIYRGLHNRSSDVRSSSIELIEHTLDATLRDAVLALAQGRAG